MGVAEAVGEGVPATTPEIATLSTLRAPAVPLRPVMAQQNSAASPALDGACALNPSGDHTALAASVVELVPIDVQAPPGPLVEKLH